MLAVNDDPRDRLAGCEVTLDDLVLPADDGTMSAGQFRDALPRNCPSRGTHQRCVPPTRRGLEGALSKALGRSPIRFERNAAGRGLV